MEPPEQPVRPCDRMWALRAFAPIATVLTITAVPAAAEPTIVERPVPTPLSLPVDIKSGFDGALYFSEENANRIGRIDSTTKVITEYMLPGFGCRPYAISGGPEGTNGFT